MKKKILLIGKPNSGKSLLFQRATGFYQKVANFPGVTVEIKTGERENSIWMDFPGTYGFNPLTRDEEIAISQFKKELENNKEQKVIICMLDATQLERSLVLALQAAQLTEQFGHPMIFAINMMDELKKAQAHIDLEGLATQLKYPVVGISAKTGEGLPRLLQMIDQSHPKALSPFVVLNNQQVPQSDSITDITYPNRAVEMAFELNQKFGVPSNQSSQLKKEQNKLDRIFLSNVFGAFIFFGIMLLLFQSIFSWAAPVMDLTKDIIAQLGAYSAELLPAGMLKDFIHDAIFGGLGSFVVFAPQIAILTFIIGILEDSGYLARASVIAHAPLRLFGLSGKSFVPYLSGHACAIPAIMAARTIESPRKRLITILTIPFTTCSARLPVYALLITAFIPAKKIAGGLITYQGLTFFSLYCLGIITALISSALLSKFLPKSVDDTPFILELPKYRLPNWKPLIKKSIFSAWLFIKKAGPIIFAINFIIWVLGYFPHTDLGLSGSYLATMGKWIEPLFAPLGLDWRYGVAILVSFLAREVFVGTLGTLFGMEGADEDVSSLAEKIQADGLGLASGLALLVFYALAMQCVSTLAVIHSETGNKRLPFILFIAYTVIAYLAARGAYFIFSLIL